MDPIDNEAQQQKNQVGRWSDEEHQRFLMGITLHGKDWKKVEEVVRTRTGSQVRSHAQKFFNKLKKEEKKKGSHKKKQAQNEGEVSDSQNSFMKGVHQDVSSTTPLELVSLIKKESQGGEKVNLKSLKKKLENEMVIKERQQQNQNDDADALQNLKRHNSYKSLNNFLAAYQNIRESPSNEFEEESFLIGLTKKYKKYFQQGGSFESLIDFGNPNDLLAAHNSIRKRSFTLPEGVQGDQDDLNERKKKLKTQNSSAPISQQTSNAFKQAVLRKRAEEEQQNKKKMLNQQENNQQECE